MAKPHLSRREVLGASGAALATAGLSQLAGAAEEDPSGLLFFDALAEIGPRLNQPIAQRWRLDDLKSEMEHCSISGVLVSYTLSTGNEPNRP